MIKIDFPKLSKALKHARITSFSTEYVRHGSFAIESIRFCNSLSFIEPSFKWLRRRVCMNYTPTSRVAKSPKLVKLDMNAPMRAWWFE